MIKHKNNIFLIFILFTVIIALICLLVIEYKFDHQPCRLCIYERIPYILSIFLIFQALLTTKYKKAVLLTLALVFFFSAGLAFYHLGIENNFFTESFICESHNFSESLSKEQLLEQLKKKNISCKDVSFKILGLSLAAINTISSIILSFIFVVLFINYEKNN